MGKWVTYVLTVLYGNCLFCFQATRAPQTHLFLFQWAFFLICPSLTDGLLCDDWITALWMEQCLAGCTCRLGYAKSLKSVICLLHRIRSCSSFMIWALAVVSSCHAEPTSTTHSQNSSGYVWRPNVCQCRLWLTAYLLSLIVFEVELSVMADVNLQITTFFFFKSKLHLHCNTNLNINTNLHILYYYYNSQNVQVQLKK